MLNELMLMSMPVKCDQRKTDEEEEEKSLEASEGPIYITHLLDIAQSI